ncbi:MAG: hypothetical protein IH946_03050 [Bacteroidetes bacterium]|nr:hypothetical protein [Bacteroidota bacterium]
MMRFFFIAISLFYINTTWAQFNLGEIYHNYGTLDGSYDLEANLKIDFSDPDSLKDISNIDFAGNPFTGSWMSLNQTDFVKDNSLDFLNSTVAQIIAAYVSGTPSTIVSNPQVGDIYIVRMRGTQVYQIMEIILVDPSDNTCSCGNVGIMEFRHMDILSCQLDLGLDDHEICPGEAVTLNAGSGFVSYTWNTGSNYQSIIVSTPGVYWVTVHDNNGCVYSDTVNITQLDIVQININIQDSILTASVTKPVNGYQWYLNDTIIPTATDSVYIAQKTGAYHVAVDDLDCGWINSDKVNFSMASIEETKVQTVSIYSIGSKVVVKNEYSILVGDTKYRIIDILGKVLMVGAITSFVSIIETQNKTPGVYFVQVLRNNSLLKTQMVYLQIF